MDYFRLIYYNSEHTSVSSNTRATQMSSKRLVYTIILTFYFACLGETSILKRHIKLILMLLFFNFYFFCSGSLPYEVKYKFGYINLEFWYWYIYIKASVYQLFFPFLYSIQPYGGITRMSQSSDNSTQMFRILRKWNVPVYPRFETWIISGIYISRILLLNGNYSWCK